MATVVGLYRRRLHRIRRIRYIPSLTTGISGSVNVTQAGDTLSATGALAITGSLSVTQAGDTLAANGVGILILFILWTTFFR